MFIKVNELNKTNSNGKWNTKQFVKNSIVILESGNVLQMPTSGIINIGNQ